MKSTAISEMALQAKKCCKGYKLLCSSTFMQCWCRNFENYLQDLFFKRGEGAGRQPQYCYCGYNSLSR